MSNIKIEFFLPHHFIDVNCSGNELKLSNCPHNGLTHYSCSSWSDAGIACFNGNTYIHSCSIYKMYLRQ